MNQITSEELALILKTFGISETEQNINTLKPHFLELKIAIFQYGLESIANELFLRKNCPNWQSKEMTILDDSRISNAVARIRKSCL